jgi:hypothetical protein
VVVSLAILFRLPETDCYHFRALRGNEGNLITETRLLAKQWENLVLNYAVEFRRGIRLQFHGHITYKQLSSFVGELLDSDGLDDSREAEEESKLCSVRSNSMHKLVICQTEDSEIVLCSREVSNGFTLKAVFWWC